MKILRTIWSRIRSLWQRPVVRREIDEELQFHIEARTAENIAAGMSPEDAAREARKRFGNVQNVREECRDTRGASVGEGMWQDVRFAIRQLRKSPGFTTVAVVSLALGIGAGTAVFSLVNSVLLSSLPVPHSEALRALQWRGSDVRMTSFEGTALREGARWRDADCVTHPAFLRLREQVAGKADVFGFAPVREIVGRAHDETFVAGGMMVSDNFFSGLGLQPFIGRLLQKGEDYAGAMNVVISHDSWEKRFASDPAVLGRTLKLNQTSFTIVGVLPRGFAGVQPGRPAEFYVPMSAESPFLYSPIARDFHWFVRLMARLEPGTTDAQLAAALNVAFVNEVAAVMKNPGMQVEPGGHGLAQDRNHYSKPLLLMLCIVGLVMMVACANLAGLSLARGAARQHELALRAALGAGRWRLIRQSLTESLALALLGGGLGIILAVWGRTFIARLLFGPSGDLRYDFPLDLTVLGFSLAVALMAAVLSGLLPALRAGRADAVGGLKSRGALGVPRLRMGRVLVAAQICLSLLLLTGAGLYVRTLINLTQVRAGFRVERLLLVQLTTRSGGYASADPARFYEQVQSSVAALPGVQSATLLGFPLLASSHWSGFFQITGQPVDLHAETYRLTVGDTFFSTMGIPIQKGRGFEASDTADAPKVVVVNESFVRNYLPDEKDPVGRTFEMLGINWRIVGVSSDARYNNIKKAAQPTTYLPFRQMFFSKSISKNLDSACIAARTSLPPLALSTAVRKAVAQIDPGAAITQITTQEAVRDQGISQERMLAILCSALAGLAVLLSCIGLYGLMAYNVARRTSEIAIRMALGATRGNVAGPILREALVLAAFGLAMGVPAALALTRFIKSQLYGVQPNDPLTLIVVGVLLIAVAVLAAWIPARRATRVNPMEALRSE